MLHVGLDAQSQEAGCLSALSEGGHLDQLAVPSDVDCLRSLARRVDGVHGEHVCAVVESMTGARLVHDTLEAEGWSVEIADAQKVKGLAPLACKTDKIDSDGAGRCSRTAIWCRRSGFAVLGFARSASSRGSGCAWSSTSQRSRTASIPR